MKQYIDKDALVVEIKRSLEFVEERLKKNNSYTEEGNIAWGRDKALYDAYNSLLHFLNTLEVKEVDLRRELDKYIDCYDVEDYITFAKYFFELGLKAQKAL